jgi:ABC-2 type transport system ATP-binding protein
MEPILKLKGVTKRFKKNNVLNSIDLDINKGEIFGIIGMSGSGKTTLMSTLIGFHEPEEGDILYFSQKHKKYVSAISHGDLVRQNFGFATQSASFYPKLTIKENLDHFGSLYKISGDSRKKHMEHLLNITGLTDSRNTLAQNLSGGMEKRLSISCSVIHKPDVLILDEPTANLDSISRRAVWDLIKEINRSGTTIIIASHLLEELEYGCDRLGILHKGKLVATGTPNQLKASYFKYEEIVLETNQKKYVQLGKTLKGYSSLPIDTISIRDNKLVIKTKDSERVLHQLLHVLERSGEEVVSADIRKPSLTEVFESLQSK